MPISLAALMLSSSVTSFGNTSTSRFVRRVCSNQRSCPQLNSIRAEFLDLRIQNSCEQFVRGKHWGFLETVAVSVIIT